mgnify:CR=1 FL=1
MTNFLQTLFTNTTTRRGIGAIVIFLNAGMSVKVFEQQLFQCCVLFANTRAKTDQARFYFIIARIVAFKGFAAIFERRTNQIVDKDT